MQTVLTIAGFDPSSGAGVTADLMVFRAHGLFGTSCVTALTVQSTLGVKATHPVAAEVVEATLECLWDDLPPAGVKIGMLADAGIVAAVARFLERHKGVPVVLDPVLRSTSGRELLSVQGIEVLRERLLPLVSWVTPNVDELEILTGLHVGEFDEMWLAARALQKSCEGLTVVATGGHMEPPDDLLLTADAEEIRLEGERVATRSTHGTGCAFSSALLSRLVMGDRPEAAARAAKKYVAGALQAAVPIGHGRGPLAHLWPMGWAK